MGVAFDGTGICWDNPGATSLCLHPKDITTGTRSRTTLNVLLQSTTGRALPIVALALHDRNCSAPPDTNSHGPRPS